MTEDLVREWTDRFSAELAEPSESIQSVEQQLENLADRIETLQKAADSIYMRWLRPLLDS
jgi:prefoldin subunit 5